jgi:hypothetical protein
MGMDVVLSVISVDGWHLWGNRFVKRQPLSRIQQTIGPNPTVDQAKAAVLKSITAAGAGGRVIINVGHGAGGGTLLPNQGSFELAPGGVMRIVGFNVANGFVDVFYDVNVKGPPAISDKENDEKNNPTSPRLARWRIYEEISRAFRAGRLREVALLTCRVGSSTEFLRKVANDWGVVIRAYRQRVALTEDIVSVGKQVTHHFYMHLENNPPAGKSAADLIVLEEEIPFNPPDTFLVGPPLSP